MTVMVRHINFARNPLHSNLDECQINEIYISIVPTTYVFVEKSKTLILLSMLPVTICRKYVKILNQDTDSYYLKILNQDTDSYYLKF